MHLRAVWTRQCQGRPDLCDYVDFRAAPNATVLLGQDGWGRVLSSMLNSTFCLQPFGDSATRKSAVDSLLLGCIPVLSHVDQRRVWPWHVGARWTEFSVLHSNPGGLLEHLQSIPAEKVASLRRGTERAARQLGYAPEDGYSDAVESLLLGAHRAVGRRGDEMWRRRRK